VWGLEAINHAAIESKQENLLGFFDFCFLFLLPTKPFHSGGARYIRRRRRESGKVLGCCLRPGAVPVGSQIQKQGLCFFKEEKNLLLTSQELG
jgi:hypothetical protein